MCHPERSTRSVRSRRTVRAAVTTIAVCVLLTGCYYDVQRIIEAASGTAPAGEAQLINSTVVAHLRKVDPSGRIGTPDCSSPRETEQYFNICTLPVDGRAVPVGLRYDEDRKRVIASLLADVETLGRLERSLTKEVQYRYRLANTTHCAGKRVQVLPAGSGIVCSVQTASRRTYTLQLRVVAKIWPHSIAYPIRGLKPDPSTESLLRVVNVAFRRSPGSVPGSIVSNFLNHQGVPLMRILSPRAGLKRAWCPLHLDVRDTTLATAGSYSSSCSVESAFGVMRIAVFTLDDKTVSFQSLSRPFDLRAFERSATAQEERYLRSHGQSALASVDCGPQRYVALYLSSVYYCQVALSSGKRARLGIEYYDPFEGPHVVWEANPS